MTEKSCLDRALTKLHYGMRTESELRKYLAELEFPEEEIDDAIEKAKDYGYLDDDKYVVEFYRYYRAKKWAEKRIIKTLKSKGISQERSSDIIKELRSSEDFDEPELTVDEREMALSVAAKMLERQIANGKDFDDKFTGKIARRLMTLGYDSSTSYYAITTLKKRNETSGAEDSK